MFSQNYMLQIKDFMENLLIRVDINIDCAKIALVTKLQSVTCVRQFLSQYATLRSPRTGGDYFLQ